MAEELTNGASDRLIEAMRILASTHPDFGRDGKGEYRFQVELQQVLAKNLGLETEREVRFPSSRFLNRKEIIADHVVDCNGVKLTIELKYVYRQGSGRPKEAQGFPYDVIKDCAKVETLIDDELGQAAAIRDGIVIGLTDFDFWDSRNRDWWSKNYLLQEHSGWRSVVAPRLFETVLTKRRSCIHPGVSVDKRFHVVLTHNWEYRWFDYNHHFRFLMLRRSRSQSNRALWIPDAAWLLVTLPFRDSRHRDDALKRKELFKASYELNGNKCPICQPGIKLAYRPFQDG